VRTDLCAPNYLQEQGGAIKGEAVRVLANQQANRLSDDAVDTAGFNAVNVAVYVGGSGSATISVEGSYEQGGNYLALSDPNASESVSSSTSFDCIVGTRWVKVRLADYLGTASFTVIVTPYQSPGMSQVQITNTAAQNLAQYNGVAVSTSNPVDVRETVGAYTTLTETAPLVTTISIGAVLAANTARLYALLINDSDTDIYLGIGVNAVVNTGIRLNALGGSYEMSKREGNLTTAAIYAIVAAGSKTLLVNEGV